MDKPLEDMDETDIFGREDKIVEIKNVDLYAYWDRERQPGAAGILTCYTQKTPEKVSTRRCRPAVLILPGGAYRWVSPREGEPVALRFVSRGYQAFVLEYSCAPFCYPTALQEAAMAMAYIRENAAEMEVDPEMVTVIGFSAGGHLCGTLGTLYDSPLVTELGLPERVRPDALALCYPVAVSWGRTHTESFENISGGDPDLAERLSLDKLVRPDMPPVFLWHTRDDGSVPCRNSLELARAMEEKNVDFAMHIYRQGCHGLATADEQAYPAGKVPTVSREVSEWPEKAMEFFREIGFSMSDQEENT